jgi:periplasmic divalent cation tolerance protein
MTTATDARLLLCTCPDEATAERLARALVDERLAACVSRVPGLASTYRWDGRVQEDAEVLLLVKTTAAALEPLQARLLALHPYEVPELVTLDITGGLPAYLAWLRASVTESESPPARS